ncbi:MAG: hypothetical protein OJF50_004594 [Nitrospira sp.]|nr:hypothetical protein [Nitrospira sp.]
MRRDRQEERTRAIGALAAFRAGLGRPARGDTRRLTIDEG